MNILLINHYAGSPVLGMEYRPFYLAREWQRLGHKVAIVAASFSHLRSRSPVVNDDITREEVSGITYYWIKTPEYQGNGVRRVFNILTFVCKLFRYASLLEKECNPNVVIASSTYPLDILPARFIAQKVGARLVFEVHDLWPLTPIELGGMSPCHPFIIMLQWAENYAYRHANKTVSLLPKTKEHMIKHGMVENKFAYVPNGIDIKEWNGLDKGADLEQIKTLKQLKNEGRFLVGYVGAHGVANALPTLIKTANLLQDAKVSIVLVGQGPEKPALIDLALEIGANATMFLPPIAKQSVPGVLGLMDILYLGWQAKPIYRFGISPNKIFDYMMSAKPIIHSVTAANDFVSDIGCGISVPAEDHEAVALAMRDLMSLDEEERTAMGLRGRKYVVENHDYRVLARKFLECIE